MGKPEPTDRRVVIEQVTPQVDHGRFPAKSALGDRVEVGAKIFADGHDLVSAVLQHKRASSRSWTASAMEFFENDTWRGGFTPTELGGWHFRLTAWVDHFRTWTHGLAKKATADVVTDLDLDIGSELVSAASSRAKGSDARKLGDLADQLADRAVDLPERTVIALSDDLAVLMASHPDRTRATVSEDTFEVFVDRERAAFSTWYELFPRSWSLAPGDRGSFADVEKQLDYVAGMGFDVLYLPPIHPIGTTFRKGPNNSLAAGSDDPGVPWAIGSELGGHNSIHPDLGTLDDFKSLLSSADDKGIEVALDLALQCSPDHPWVKENPEWFRHRPDGSIQYAENPPKKYQDIYPIDFETSDPESLWNGLKEVFNFWIDQGVRIFRVDNPHTKAFPFWEWLITDLRSEHPDVILLAEAFTRPAVMHRLAKVGFNQSYTYFTWRNTKHEIVSYMHELAGARDYFRPNFWPNTPDILPEMLQTGTRAAFISRYVLAATLSSNCGIYGPAFELMEHRPLRPGAEEYADSEKYQIRHWDLDREDTLAPLITQINRARHSHPALQRNENLTFHHVDNEMILSYSKRTGTDVVLTVVSLDPHHSQTGWIDLDLGALGLNDDQYQVRDLITDRLYLWSGSRNFVHLDVGGIPAHIFSFKRPTRTERDFDYFS
ncbi:MAG: alpha-1,4-glucan--maltose-1-phosphate maltosyltransferase [Acidimicrobiia bacterium]